jgi:hypothetical protein
MDGQPGILRKMQVSPLRPFRPSVEMKNQWVGAGTVGVCGVLGSSTQ